MSRRPEENPPTPDRDVSGSPRPVRRRVTVLFTGFEPLDAAAHRDRFGRTVAQSARLWGFGAEPGPLRGPESHPHFDVEASGPGWRTQSRVFVLDHCALISRMRAESIPAQILHGYGAFLRVVAAGGLWRYLRRAWRFGLFFVFPFLLMTLALALSTAIALAPWLAGYSPLHLLWSAPAALIFFRHLFLPWSDRFHTLHLFANWRLAFSVARLDDEIVNARLRQCEEGLRAALGEPADEYVIASHSMGGNFATHALGALLEREPQLLAGRRVVFATFGGATLQCALLRPAARMRERAGGILRAPQILWYEVQTLTDPVHFYKTPVASALGHGDAPAPTLLAYRVKLVLTGDHYRRIKTDILRVHRQYVLGADLRGPYDFGLLVAGPLPAASFVRYSHRNLPPLEADGSITAGAAST